MGMMIDGGLLSCYCLWDSVSRWQQTHHKKYCEHNEHAQNMICKQWEFTSGKVCCPTHFKSPPVVTPILLNAIKTVSMEVEVSPCVGNGGYGR